MDDNPHMSDDLKERLKQVIERKGLSWDAASREAGMERSYFSKLFDGKIGNPRIDTLHKIAAKLDVSPDWLVNGVESAPIVDVRSGPPGAVPLVPHRDDMPNDVPVRGTAAGSHTKGSFSLYADIIDYVRRPPALAGARDVYALYVEGESMIPQYAPGEVIFVHPRKPVRIGDPVVVQVSYRDGEFEGTIGIYRRPHTDWIVIGKHNPVAEVQIKRGNETQVHRILTMNELFGI